MEDVAPGTRFDAVLCLGNSLSALPDFDGGQAKHRRALGNFWALVRPGGLLVIDHRNYNCILETGIFPSSNIYYDVSCQPVLDRNSLVGLDGKEKQNGLSDPSFPIAEYFNDCVEVRSDGH